MHQFYFLYLQALAFRLSENSPAALGLKEVGADWSGHGALNTATNTGRTYKCFWETGG